jgi:biopolymer transport protein TolR
MTGGPTGRRLLAEINVIPLVDVVLVLLIIFMITAPLLYRGIDIKLPQAATNTIKPEERRVLTIERNEAIYLDKDPMTLGKLSEVLPALRKDNPNLSIYLRADRDVNYGLVVSVMDLVKRSGIDKLGIVTEPSPRDKS